MHTVLSYVIEFCSEQINGKFSISTLDESWLSVRFFERPLNLAHTGASCGHSRGFLWPVLVISGRKIVHVDRYLSTTVNKLVSGVRTIELRFACRRATAVRRVDDRRRRSNRIRAVHVDDDGAAQPVSD